MTAADSIGLQSDGSGTWAQGPVPEFPLRIPDHIRDRYARLVLVSEPHHLDEIDLADGETLAIAYDWLLWRRQAEKGSHCLHFETGLLTWDDRVRPKRDLFLRANRWMLVNGRDVTLFRGVSLGKQFIGETALALASLIRLEVSLAWLCRTFRPAEVILFNCRTEEFEPAPETKRLIAERATALVGARLVVRGRLASGREPTYGRIARGADPERSLDLLRRVYGVAIGLVFRLRDLIRRPGAKRILILPTGAMLHGLLRSFDRSAVEPLMLAELTPKRFSFILASLRRGLGLRRLGRGRLSRREQRAVDAMVATLRRHWFAAPAGDDPLLRSHLEHGVFAERRLHSLAAEAKQILRFLARHRPRRVLVSSVRNQRIFCDAARTLGIPADFLMHGIYFSTFVYEALCGDGAEGPVVARVLTWGPHNETWLRLIGAAVPVVRTGHPAYARFRLPGAMIWRRDARILFLPYTWMISDYPVFSAECMENLIQTVWLLQADGYTRVKVKLHPGVRNRTAIQEVLDHFGLEAELCQDGDLASYVAWADMVIGIVWSSSFLEVIACGKPYVPVLLPSSIADPRLLVPFRLVRSPDDLRRALAGDLDQDWEAILETFVSYGSIEDSSARIWHVLSDAEPSPHRMAVSEPATTTEG